MVKGSTDFSLHTVYKPEGGRVLVKSSCSTIYYFSGDEAFYAAIDSYLAGFTWVNMMSWQNKCDVVQQYSLQFATALKVTSGKEVENSVGIEGTFEGLSLGLNNSTKTFSSHETTESQTKTLTINVPPMKKVTFYQRRYEFENTMFFILDAWNKEWNAGSPGGYEIARKGCTVHIMSEDYLTTETELSNARVGIMKVERVNRLNAEGDRVTRKRENLTARAKRELSKDGTSLPWRARSTIYYFRVQEAYAAIDSYLVGFTWVTMMSRPNNSEATQTYSLEFTTQPQVTTGNGVMSSVGINIAYEGLSLSLLHNSTKTFSVLRDYRLAEKNTGHQHPTDEKGHVLPAAVRLPKHYILHS
ncbi:hypothetical protein C8Q74DRAFT_1371541 [Fomes fomentarius]|nr:hypothetical protein C8Q74DRAFT_1371541 [Fomes fomentarius]